MNDETLTAVPRVIPLRTQAENAVLRAARKYGRMKAFGSYVDANVMNGAGSVVKVCGTDVDMYLRTFHDELMYNAVRLVESMSIDEQEGSLIE